MKNVLDYSKQELETLTDYDLKELLRDAEYHEALFNTKQLAGKLSINSLYGALGNRWFPLFNQDIARSITGNGRYFIKKMSNYIEEVLQDLLPNDEGYGLYNDTDSFYFTLEPFVEKSGLTDTQEIVDFCDKFYEQIIDKAVQKSIADFTMEFNVFNPSMIGAEREIIADAGVFVAKKKYFARVLDSEGVRYSEPYLKVMGLEIIKSSTPKFTKKMLKQSINIILDSNKKALSEWLEETKKLYTKESLGDIASIGGVSNLEYVLGAKGIPIGARSALVHNNYCKENNLIAEFAPIQGGDKTKRLYLIEPNPLNSNIVAFLDDRFIEPFKEYIDYDTNFEKGFLSPLQLMTSALKWNMNHTIDALDEW